MSPHEIDLDGLQKWLSESTVTFASSTRERKRLEVTLNGGLIVTVGGKKVWEGIQQSTAVEKYNSIVDVYQNPTKDFVL